MHPTRSRQDRFSFFKSLTGLRTTLDRFWLDAEELSLSTSRERAAFGLAVLEYSGTRLLRTTFLRDADPREELFRRRNSGVVGFRKGFDGPRVQLLSFREMVASLDEEDPGELRLSRLFQNCFSRWTL